MKIEFGVISQDGKTIGTARKEFRFGYHLAVHVTVNKGRGRREEKWFELDAPDLLAKIGDFAREHMYA